MGVNVPTPVAALPVATTDPARAVFSTIVLDALKAEIGATAFESWFGRIELDRIDGATAHLTLPTKFLASWVSTHYSAPLFAAVTAGFSTVSKVWVGVRSTGRPAPQSAERRVAEVTSSLPAPTASFVAPCRMAQAPATIPFISSPLDSRLTFASLKVGAANGLACAAATGVLQDCIERHRPRYAPLVVHGEPGVGKTHLLQSVVNAATEAGRRAFYLTAERFLYGFPAGDRASLRTADLLAIDDIHHLGGAKVMRDLGAMVDAFTASGKVLVMASSLAPVRLEDFDAALRSRLCAGLDVAVAAPDFGMRRAIVEARAEALRLKLTPEIVTIVAETIRINGRDLEGAVNRLVAHTSFLDRPLNAVEVTAAISDLVRAPEPRRPRIEEIQSLVARHFNVSRNDILSSRRTHNVVRPRQIAMYLAKTMTLRSLPEIGRRFGGRDHTTAMHAVRKIEALTSKDAALADEVNGLRRMLEAA